MTTTDQKAGDRYLIRKRGAFYRPNAEGYTNNKAEAGRYTLAQAIWHSHPNGPNGPRDGIDYVLADEPAAPCLASVSSASEEPEALDWRLIAKAAGEHGVRYRTNTAMAKFLAAIASPEPVPATNQAGEVEASCTMGVGCDEAGVCYAAANGQPSMCERSVTADPLQKALLASLAKRSVPTMDPPYTAAFNAALDMVERDTASSLSVLSDEVVALVIAAREFWDDNNDQSDESHALDKALQAFSSRVPYDNEPALATQPATSQEGDDEGPIADAARRIASWSGNKVGVYQAAKRELSATATSTPPTLSEDLREAVELFVKLERRVLADMASAHSQRGPGASSEMRSDDRDDMAEAKAAFETARAALARAQGQAS